MLSKKDSVLNICKEKMIKRKNFFLRRICVLQETQSFGIHEELKVYNALQGDFKNSQPFGSFQCDRIL